MKGVRRLLPHKPRLEMQAFTDGRCLISATRNLAQPGKKPDWQPVIRCSLRFSERAISINRRQSYLQHDMRIDRLIRCRRQQGIDTHHVATIGDTTYHIRKIDHPVGVLPPVMDLALERVRQDDT